MRFAEPWFVLFLLLLMIGKGLIGLLRSIAEKVSMHFYTPPIDWVSEWNDHPLRALPPAPPPGPPDPPIPISWETPPARSSLLSAFVHHSSTIQSAANSDIEPPKPRGLWAVRDAFVADLEVQINRLRKDINDDGFDEESSFRAGDYGEARRAEKRAESKGRQLTEIREQIRRLKKPRKARGLDELIQWTSEAPNGELPVYLLMREDCWETVFGDGYYVYFSDAFMEREEADAWATVRDKAEEGTAHHVVSVTFKVPNNESSAVLALTDPNFALRHASALTIAERLVANHED